MTSQANQRLAALDQAGRDASIADTKSRYPNWIDGDPDESSENFQKAVKELAADGSFWGCFKQVFSLFDLLWIFLGASTAYGTAKKYGPSV